MFKRRGEIVAVKDLFAKYKTTLKAPQKTVELEAIRVVGELFNFTLREDQVLYIPNTKTLSFNVPGLLKQEIKLRQNDILSELSSRLGEKSSPKSIF
jgi:hypothetical protein